MNEQELIQFVLDYREGILDGKSSFNMCWVVTQPLSLLLSEVGVEHEVVVFDIDTSHCVEPMAEGVIEHFCIKIGNKILDATADQFKGMDKVYFGSRPVWYADARTED